jgi:hypothetical protein
MTKEQRKRLAAIRAVAPLAVPHCQHQPVDEIEEAGDEKPQENLPQVNRASLRGGDSSNI